MKTIAFNFLLIFTLSFAQPSAAKENLTPQDFYGVWELKASINEMPNGEIVPYCNGVHGRIIYTKEGLMSVALNCGERTRSFEPADISGRKFFYSGRFTTDGKNVYHHILNASDTHLIGQTSTRKVTLVENRIILAGENQGQIFEAHWERVQ